jgi:predicted nuclease of predicted toxin-antitoxin system
MNLMADECVDRQVIARLRKEGHEVLYVAEMDPGISDEAILKRANQNNALLLTTDKDYGELIFRQNRISAGVLLIRLTGLSQIEKTRVVSSIIHDHSNELFQSFTVVSPGRVRIRKKI